MSDADAGASCEKFQLGIVGKDVSLYSPGDLVKTIPFGIVSTISSLVLNKSGKSEFMPIYRLDNVDTEFGWRHCDLELVLEDTK